MSAAQIATCSFRSAPPLVHTVHMHTASLPLTGTLPGSADMKHVGVCTHNSQEPSNQDQCLPSVSCRMAKTVLQGTRPHPSCPCAIWLGTGLHQLHQTTPNWLVYRSHRSRAAAGSMIHSSAPKVIPNDINQAQLHPVPDDLNQAQHHHETYTLYSTIFACLCISPAAATTWCQGLLDAAKEAALARRLCCHR